MKRKSTASPTSRRASPRRMKASAPRQLDRSTKTKPFATQLLEVFGLLAELAPDVPCPQPVGAATGKRSEPTAEAVSLHQKLSLLPLEAASKLWSLLVAGRDGCGIAEVDLSKSQAGIREWFSADVLDDRAPCILEYLRRGHAIACATALDLEAPVAEWMATTPESLEERVWLRFGLQLAQTPLDGWKCLGTSGSAKGTVATLYVQAGTGRWWSFHRVLDRPSAQYVENSQRRRAKPLGSKSTGNTLAYVAASTVTAQHRALRRALRAIRARTGVTLAGATR